MSESQKTLTFVGVAVASVLLAVVSHVATAPSVDQGGAGIGDDFWPDFDDPSLAKSLTVVTFDENLADIDEFIVEQQDNGIWTIPSHSNYPADAEDRLYETAASMIGIKKGSLRTRRESDHEQFGVLDPRETDASKLKGRGDYISLTTTNGEVLSEYIIGDKAPEGEDLYYVRIPKQDDVYIAEVDIDLSTDFADWIEPDLLKLTGDDLVEIEVNKYTINERQGTIEGQEVNKLEREKFGDPWKLGDLNEDEEEMLTSDINTMVRNLDDFKIAGVRRKPEGLTADLQLDRSLARNPVALQMLQRDLQRHGFFFGPPDEAGKQRLYANEGELHAATNEGLVYTLRFGEIFSGSKLEVETGFSGDDKQDADDGNDAPAEAGAPEAADAAVDSDEDSTDSDAGGSDDELKTNRYIFVSVRFDDQYLEKPTPPIEPQKSAELIEAEKQAVDRAAAAAAADGTKEEDGGAADDDEGDGATEQPDNADDVNGSQDDSADAAAGSDATEGEDAASPEESAADDAKAELERLQKEYEDARTKYETDLKDYETKLKEYGDKVEDGKKKAQELNDRFARWYYVISGDKVETLRLSRADLVKAKEKTDDDETKSDDAAPADSADDGDAAPAEGSPAPKTDADNDSTPADPTPADPKPEADAPAAGDKTESPVDAAQSDSADDASSDKPDDQPAADDQTEPPADAPQADSTDDASSEKPDEQPKSE